MKILMLNHNIAGVGTFHRCRYVAKPLAVRGHDITIATTSPHHTFSFDEHTNGRICTLETPDLLMGQLRSGWDPVNAWRRIRYLEKRERFDVIHAFDCRPTVIFPALALQKRWRCRLVIDWCDWWGRGGAITLREPRWLNRAFEPIETFFEEHYRKYADHITTISEPLKERAIGLGISPEKVTVIPPIADTEEMYPVDKSEARRKLGLDPNTSILIFSSFVKYDIQFLLAAFARVFSTNKNVLLLVTGAHPKHFSSAAKSLPIRSVGQVSKEDLRLYLGASDVCLLPLSDTLANRVRYPDKLRNYLSAGRPVITTRVGEAAMLVEKYELGLVSEPHPESFADRILEALSHRERTELWGQKARKAAQTELSEKHYPALLEQIYLGNSPNPMGHKASTLKSIDISA